MYSSKQSRFLVTETDAQSIGGSDVQPAALPRPAQAGRVRVRLARRGDDRVLALAHAALRHRDLLGRRAAAQPRAGPGLPGGRRVGAELQAIGTTLDGFEPDADVAILWSNDSRFALEFFPPLATADGQPDRASYQHIVDAFHRGVIDAGAQSRILHVSQAHALGAEELAARFPVLVAPGAVRGIRRRPRPAPRLRRGRRAPHRRHPHGLRRRGGPGARRGRPRAAPRGGGRALRGVLEPPPRRAGHAGAGRSRHPTTPRPAAGPTGWSPRRRDARALRPPAVRRLPGGHDERARRRPHHGRRHGALARAGRRPRALGGAVADRRRARRPAARCP